MNSILNAVIGFLPRLASYAKSWAKSRVFQGIALIGVSWASQKLGLPVGEDEMKQIVALVSEVAGLGFDPSVAPKSFADLGMLAGIFWVLRGRKNAAGPITFPQAPQAVVAPQGERAPPASP